MKILRLLLASALVLTGASAFAAATKTKTYTVVGFYEREKPSDELFAQATAAVARKVAGMVQITNSLEADHVIEVLFTRNQTFEVYVDALPLTTYKSYALSPTQAYNGDYSMERAETNRSSSNEPIHVP